MKLITTQHTPKASSDMLLGLREASEELGITLEADLKSFGIEPRRKLLPL